MEKFETSNEYIGEGILEERYDNERSEWVLQVKWVDGEIVEWHIPAKGMPLADMDGGGKIIGILPADKARAILNKNSLSLLREDFSWLDYRDQVSKIVRTEDSSHGKNKKTKAA